LICWPILAYRFAFNQKNR